MRKVILILAGLLILGGAGATLLARDKDNPLHWAEVASPCCPGTEGGCITNIDCP